MRELREALDGRQSRDGGRLAVGANVLYDADYNRSAALDLETWVREGLVDILLPATNSQGVDLIDYEYYKGPNRGKRPTVFYADLLPRHMSGKEYVDAAPQGV